MDTSCDEYPFASTVEGGSGAIVRGVPLSEYPRQGGQFSAFLKQNAVALFNSNGRFKVCVIIQHGQRNGEFGAC